MKEVFRGRSFGELAKVTSVILASFLNSNTKADVLDFVPPESISVVSSAQSVGKSTINENWLAWEQEGKIHARNRQTLEEYLICDSGSSKNPKLDRIGGKNIVYDKQGSIRLFDLETFQEQNIYTPSGEEICDNPKINGDNIVFRFYANPDDFEIGSIVGYSISRKRFYPVSESLNVKRNPDIHGRYIVWGEEDDCIAFPEKRKISTKVLDLETGQEHFLTRNFIGSNVYSLGVYEDKIVGVASSSSWDNGPASLVIHDMSYYENAEIPTTRHIGMGLVHSNNGKKDQLAIHKNLMVWTEMSNGTIKGVDLNSTMSTQQFIIAGPNCYNPDVYVDSEDRVNVSYMQIQSPEPQGQFGLMSTNNNLESLVSCEVIPYPGPSKCGDRGTRYLQGDINQDCYVNLEDYAILAQMWLKEGLTNYVDHSDPNSLEYCEVSPEIYQNGKIISLDFNGDCRAGMYEFITITNNWLKCTDPENVNCNKYWRRDE